MSDKAKAVLRPTDERAFPMVPEGGSDRFGAEIVDVNGPLGLGLLGAMQVSVSPGKRAFPFHNHLGNDEMFVILEGEGTYRFGAEEHAVKAGDICGAPRGGPDKAHQLINTGQGVLRYLGISTRRDPDVVQYPDSDKFAAMAIHPGADFMSAALRFVGKLDDNRDYWEGEET